VPGPVSIGIEKQAGSLQKGTELGGIYSPQLRDDLTAGVISILPVLGIKKAVSWGTAQQCLKWNT
jgi:hypothetical protein